MAYHLIDIPDDVYDRARRTAQKKSQSIDQVIVEQLRTLSVPRPDLASVEKTELRGLRCLPDDALRAIVRQQMPADAQKCLQRLTDRNNFGAITEAELSELERLIECGNRLMMRKAEAASILMDRGHRFIQRDTLTFFHFD